MTSAKRRISYRENLAKVFGSQRRGFPIIMHKKGIYFPIVL